MNVIIRKLCIRHSLFTRYAQPSLLPVKEAVSVPSLHKSNQSSNSGVAFLLCDPGWVVHIHFLTSKFLLSKPVVNVIIRKIFIRHSLSPQHAQPSLLPVKEAVSVPSLHKSYQPSNCGVAFLLCDPGWVVHILYRNV